MEFDVAVLGGGPGGYSAAIRAAQLGAKTACIEKEERLGGTCLRIGCIPTKAWVQTAFAIKEAEETFAKLGVNVGAARARLRASRTSGRPAVVEQLTGGVATCSRRTASSGSRGTGRFKDANTISVEGGEDVSFKSAIIATGSYPAAPADRRASTRRAASTRPGSSTRPRCPGASSSSAAASSAASSPPSSSASAAR